MLMMFVMGLLVCSRCGKACCVCVLGEGHGGDRGRSRTVKMITGSDFRLDNDRHTHDDCVACSSSSSRCCPSPEPTCAAGTRSLHNVHDKECVLGKSGASSRSFSPKSVFFVIGLARFSKLISSPRIEVPLARFSKWKKLKEEVATLQERRI